MRTLTRHIATIAAAATVMSASAATAVNAQSAGMATPCCQTVTPTTLNINVSSEVKKAPDLATISAGVVTTSRTSKAAMDENARKMTAAFAALRAAGIAERDMQTSGINLTPQYDYQSGTRPKITGYQASNTVTVRLRQLANIGAVLDALVAQGVNDINGPNFTLENPEAELDKARTDAMTTAMRRAELYARASNMRVKRVVSISESGGYQQPQPMPMMMARMASADAAAPTPVAAGEVSLSIQLSVQFEFEK